MQHIQSVADKSPFPELLKDLPSDRNQIITSGQGAVRTNIGQGDLSQVKVPLPPLSEQKAIAQLLSKVDLVIQLNEKLIVQKEQRKKWLMQQLLTGTNRLKGYKEKW